MTLRIVDTGLRTARENIAMTRSLFDECGGGETLRFHRYADCFLLGAGQEADEEVDLARCAARCVTVARRITGGGTLYLDRDVLAFDYVVAGRAGAPRAATARVSALLVDALGTLGIAACADADGDVFAGGRKVAGSAGFFAGRTVLAQGFVFLKVNRRAMVGLWRRRGGTRAARIAVAGLAGVSMEALKDAMRQHALMPRLAA